MGWKPLHAREGVRTDAFDVLHEGVPAWMSASLWDWFVGAVEQLATKYKQYSIDILRSVEIAIRTPLDIDDYNMWKTLAEKLRRDDELFLTCLDRVVYVLGISDRVPSIESLEFLLHQGGSVWRVSQIGYQNYELQKRVDEEARQAALEVMSSSDEASAHLREAWSDIFGRDPDPTDGYHRAVKAVETVAQPVISPQDTVATLGKMISAMSDKPEKWRVVLYRDTPAEAVDDVVAMMRLLWKGQHDRHGKPGAPDVSKEEAEAAIHLAVTLVQWFRTGVVSTAP
jgi:hypothetical protein